MSKLISEEAFENFMRKSVTNDYALAKILSTLVLRVENLETEIETIKGSTDTPEEGE